MAYDKPFEHKEGWGNIFKRSEATGNQPTLKGTIKLPADVTPGQDVEIALWLAKDQDGKIKLDKNKNKYFSAQISKPWVKPGSEEAAPTAAPPEADSADDLF